MPYRPRRLNTRSVLLLHLFYLALFLVNLFYYHEIALGGDADEVLHMISEKGFSFVHHRWGIFSNQVLPLLASIMELPLNIILMTAAISPVVVSFLLATITLRLLQNEKLAWLIALCNVLALGDSYIYKHWTLLLGMQYLVLLTGLFLNDKATHYALGRWLYFLAGSWITFILISTHNAFALLIPAVIFFLFLLRASFRNRAFIWMIIYILIVLSRLLFFPTTGYETTKYADVLTFFSSPEHILNASVWKYIEENFLKLYWYPAALLAITSLHLLRQSKRLETLAIWLACFGVLLFVASILDPIDYINMFLLYYEGNLLGTVVLMVIPFVLEFKAKVVRPVLMAGIVYYSAILLTTTLPEMKRETQAMVQILQQMSDKPYYKIIHEKKLLPQINNFYFDYTGKTLLLSSSVMNEAKVLFATNDTTNQGTDENPVYVVRDTYFYDDPEIIISKFQPNVYRRRYEDIKYFNFE